MRSLSTRLITNGASAIALVFLAAVPGIAQPTLSLSKDFVPPVDDSPCCLSGGGTRGPATDVAGNPLTALVPQRNYERTTEAYPTLMFYLPQHRQATPDLMAELVVLDEDHQIVYREMFPVSDTAGILRVSLETANAPLEIGQSYLWVFSLVYDPLNRDTDVFVQGMIQRVEPDAVLAQHLAQADPSDRPLLYAQAGFWYEALATMADLREQDPNNAALLAQWSELLEAAGLQSFTQQPLLAIDVSADGSQVTVY